VAVVSRLKKTESELGYITEELWKSWPRPSASGPVLQKPAPPSSGAAHETSTERL
jgi:hypothetical protein